MKKFKIFMTLAVILPLVSFAQIQSKKVTFGPGKSGTLINGTIKGDLIIDYLLSVNANQTISIALNSKSTSIYFNVMEPGSTGEAIYIGENEGTNKFNGTASQSGTYKIRVFLNRAVARRGSSASYGLNISVKGGGVQSKSTDAKVAGTKYHATGNVDAALGNARKGSSTAKFGVVRGSGTAAIDVQIKGLLKHTLKFAQGEWTSNGDSVNAKKSNDEWEVILNDYEHYYIPEGIIYGG
ncbi:conserved exported hypothetical protein [Flavobacterium sp. 9R]|uniref:hypothetical protein n=1 Tax=Flavobacterium sp. 9R TaxID=2653143 RepID=UPI0012F0A260|nr:hypothetical protein [Flavobacterium sp. 9R]VXB17362.1 conserved exported hypothetical protein [Flavobacterium sp. 9R]